MRDLAYLLSDAITWITDASFQIFGAGGHYTTLVLGVICVTWWLWPAGKRKRRKRVPSRQETRGRHADWHTQAQQTLQFIRQHPTTPDDAVERLRTMNPYAFEYLITGHFNRRGYDTRKITRASGDGGIDGMVHINGRWHLVQAKRYGRAVSRGAVAQFADLCIAKRMPGMFITTSGFSASTIQQFRNHHPKLILIDGQGLIILLTQGVSSLSSAEESNILC